MCINTSQNIHLRIFSAQLDIRTAIASHIAVLVGVAHIVIDKNVESNDEEDQRSSCVI